MQKVAAEFQQVVGDAHAADLLAQWEGFGRFCRDVLGAEPLVLTAVGMGSDDAAAEVRAASPGAHADEADVASSAAEWAGTWRRRFGHEQGEG